VPECPNGLANLLQNLSFASANVAIGNGGVVPEEVPHRTIPGDNYETSSAQWELSENGRDD
jgi:hypothetical protein